MAYDIVYVNLNDIEFVEEADLSQRKLNTLENGYLPFEQVLDSTDDPVSLDRGKGGALHRIINGRHRIFLCRKKGYTSIPATFIG